MSEHSAEKDAGCRCGHPLHEYTCDCGWLDCECPVPAASEGDPR